MKRLVPGAVALALAACGGGAGGDTGDAWHDTPLSVAAPYIVRDLFDAESYFSPGDWVIDCGTGAQLTVTATALDSTAQLSDGRWYAYADLIQDGSPYTCDGQRRPLPPTPPGEL